MLAIGTFSVTKSILRFSIYIPVPLIALAICTLLVATVWSDAGVTVLKDKYGSIPSNYFVFTPPQLPTFSSGVLIDIVYYVVAIVFVSGVESLLCSSMADRLAGNKEINLQSRQRVLGKAWYRSSRR